MLKKKLDSLYQKSKISTPHGILASLWRTILQEKNLVGSIPTLLEVYRNQPNSETGSVSTAEKVSKTEITLKEILSDTMTFNILLKLIANLLKPDKVKITLEITKDGETTSHSQIMKLKR